MKNVSQANERNRVIAEKVFRVLFAYIIMPAIMILGFKLVLWAADAPFTLPFFSIWSWLGAIVIRFSSQSITLTMQVAKLKKAVEALGRDRQNAATYSNN